MQILSKVQLRVQAQDCSSMILKLLLPEVGILATEQMDSSDVISGNIFLNSSSSLTKPLSKFPMFP